MQVFFDKLDMDVICVSESWLKKHHSDKRFSLDGFKLFRADRGGHRRGGGSAIYAKSNLKSKILAQSTQLAPVNYIFLEI